MMSLPFLVRKVFVTTMVTKEKYQSDTYLNPFVYVVSFVFKASRESRHD